VPQDKVAEQHTAVHAFHHHIPHGAHRRGSSATGIIWLLVVLHVAFVAYWGEPCLAPDQQVVQQSTWPLFCGYNAGAWDSPLLRPLPLH
jgi:hypothetical protein